VKQQDARTIEGQNRTLQDHVRKNGWTLVRPIEEYEDDGRSAKTGTLKKRSGLLRLLEDARRSPRLFDIVVIWDVKRLSRTISWHEKGEMLGTLQDAGILLSVVSKRREVDLLTDEGNSFISKELSEAASDNSSRSENVMIGKLEAIMEGRKPSGPTPFGLQYHRDRERNLFSWGLDPDLAPIVEEIFTRIARGETCPEIACDLQRRGVMRARPSRSGKRKAGVWNRERVWQIARNPVYKGEWCADRRRGLTVKVPSIVPERLWLAADQKLRVFGKRGLTKTKHTYLIQGLAVCGLCGARIGCCSTTSGASDRKKLRYYICGRRRRAERLAGEPPCDLPLLRADDVDGRSWRAIIDTLSRPAYVEAAMQKRAASDEERNLYAKDLAEAKVKLQAFDARCAQIADDFRRGLLPREIYEDQLLSRAAKERTMLVRQVEAAQAGVDISTQRTKQTESVVAATRLLRGRLVGANEKTRRELVQALVSGDGTNVVKLFPSEIAMSLRVSAEVEDTRLSSSAAG
jgi:site-specific DNA recombinase